MMESKSNRSKAVEKARRWIVRGWPRAAALVVVLGLAAGPAPAQVPQDVTFRGRLVDSVGTPEVGPVNLELRVFDDPAAGTELYAESHSGVTLDVTGAFSVQLGLGTPLSGTFGAALFSEVDRWLEVVVDAQVLSPRQIIASVPWALIAQQANEIVPDPNAPRFEDCGDGTVADHQTGLQWEKKTGTIGSSVFCETAGCPDPHDVNNRYEWSDTGTEPDGGAFTDFLARLNATLDPFNPTGCFAGHCDWRLREISDHQAILIGPDAAPGQAMTCTLAQRPCIDPDFAAVGGPTATDAYWTETPLASNLTVAWYAFMNGGSASNDSKTADNFVRAVRTGSCN